MMELLLRRVCTQLSEGMVPRPLCIKQLHVNRRGPREIWEGGRGRRDVE